jgi:hypothetical protein
VSARSKERGTAPLCQRIGGWGFDSGDTDPRTRPTRVETGCYRHPGWLLGTESSQYAVGVEGRTAADYAADCDKDLQTLLDRAKSGTYYAPPVRRVRTRRVQAVPGLDH